MAEAPRADADRLAVADDLVIELEAYNRAFAELELPWQWDARTFLDLLSTPDRDCVGAYVERSQPHLLRVYEKAFLRNLVSCARDRCRQESQTAAC